jgi:RHS repeat-associated protein
LSKHRIRFELLKRMTGYVKQLASRTVPGYVNILGEATNTASVSVNTTMAYGKDRYFRAELAVNNTANPVWLGITNVAVLAVDASHYVASIETGHVFVPKTPETFTYDADGNLLSDGRWNYTWDAENRLVKVESRSDTPQASWRRVEWTYDALGRRIRQATSEGSSGTWQVTEDLKFVSDPVLFGRHVAELRASDNALVRTYVWGLDLSGTIDGAGGVGGLLWLTLHTASGPAAGTHFAAYDGNGNIVALSAASDGSESARYEYGPFGEPIRVTGPTAKENLFRFSTKRTDNTTDLVLYEYRAYSPVLGRWPSPDPIGELGFTLLTTGRQPFPEPDLYDDEPGIGANRQPSKPSELNLYGFALNEPQNRVDPLGLISFDRCSDEKKAILTAAWNSVCQMVNDPKFQCCVGRSTFLQMFKRRCAWGNVKFKCRNNDEGLCPWVCAHAWESLGIGRGVIVVCDRDPSECNMPSWKCLLAHEFSHVIGWDPRHRGVTKTVDNCCRQH